MALTCSWCHLPWSLPISAGSGQPHLLVKRSTLTLWSLPHPCCLSQPHPSLLLGGKAQPLRPTGWYRMVLLEAEDPRVSQQGCPGFGVGDTLVDTESNHLSTQVVHFPDLTWVLGAKEKGSLLGGASCPFAQASSECIHQRPRSAKAWEAGNQSTGPRNGCRGHVPSLCNLGCQGQVSCLVPASCQAESPCSGEPSSYPLPPG